MSKDFIKSLTLALDSERITVMTTIHEGLTALRAAKLAFEAAGKQGLANSCREWISEVEDEIRFEERVAKNETRIKELTK